MQILDILAALDTKFSDQITGKKEFRGENTLNIDPAALVDVMQFCRDKLGFNFLVDILSVDNFGEEPRFEMVYELHSLDHGNHLRIKTSVSEDNLEVPTVSDLWPGANWLEREVYDLMGIKFADHPDLRRILMWDGFPYHPLRKDFPLEGKVSEMEEMAFSDIAPMEGGPFFAGCGTTGCHTREPRSHKP